jgi:hypothetical protein
MDTICWVGRKSSEKVALCRIKMRRGELGKIPQKQAKGAKNGIGRLARRASPTLRLRQGFGGQAGPLTVRLGPHKSAWDRLNFFLRVKMERKRWLPDCGGGLRGHNRLGWVGKVRNSSHPAGHEMIIPKPMSQAQSPKRRRAAALQDAGARFLSRLHRVFSTQVVGFPHLSAEFEVQSAEGGMRRKFKAQSP